MKEIYIEMKEVVKFDKRKVIKIKDIASVEADEKLKEKVLELPISEGKYNSEVIKRLDVIKIIKDNLMFVTVNVINQEDTLIIFNEEKENKILVAMKVVFGTLIFFFGTFVAIIAFQNDTSLPQALRNIYVLLTGNNNVKTYAIEIPYSIGIALGSIMFFMKFKNKNISPIEIELDKYEKDVKTSECKKLESEGKV